MVTVSYAIMAHPKRRNMISGLVEKLGISKDHVVWDQKNDRWDTGRRSMLSFDPKADYHVVIQDDAVPCRDLIAGLVQVYSHIPEGTPLCLYMGSQIRPLINRYVRTRKDRVSWCTMDHMNWGVGIVMPVPMIPDMVKWADGRPDIQNYDVRIGRWLQHQKQRIWYPWPSLVDHQGVESLVKGRTARRYACQFVGADTSALKIDWTGSVVDLPTFTRASERYALGNPRSAMIRRIPPGTYRQQQRRRVQESS